MMFSEYGLSIGLAAGVAVVLVAGSAFTPVIPRGNETALNDTEVANATQAYGYCSANLPDVDCACFAGRAGMVMSHNGLDIRGADTIDRTELARLQAVESC